jgi:hypothetical protein
MNSVMWTATTRAQHKRDGRRFASDLTDADWAVVEPLLLPPARLRMAAPSRAPRVVSAASSYAESIPSSNSRAARRSARNDRINCRVLAE